MVRDCTSSTFKLFIQIFNLVNKAVILTRTRTRAAASRAGVAADIETYISEKRN